MCNVCAIGIRGDKKNDTEKYLKKLWSKVSHIYEKQIRDLRSSAKLKWLNSKIIMPRNNIIQ